MRLYEIEDIALKDLQKMRRGELEKYQLKMAEGTFGNIIESIFFK